MIPENACSTTIFQHCCLKIGILAYNWIFFLIIFSDYSEIQEVQINKGNFKLAKSEIKLFLVKEWNKQNITKPKIKKKNEIFFPLHTDAEKWKKNCFNVKSKIIFFCLLVNPNQGLTVQQSLPNKCMWLTICKQTKK